jgi:hypothetical protein
MDGLLLENSMKQGQKKVQKRRRRRQGNRFAYFCVLFFLCFNALYALYTDMLSIL